MLIVDALERAAAQAALRHDEISAGMAAMRDEVRANLITKGFRNPDGSPQRTFLEDMALLTSEIGEAVDAFRTDGLADQTGRRRRRWVLRSRPRVRRLPKPEGVGSELADILIRLVDTADAFGVDLAAEYHRKMAYNRTRSYRHGGQAA